MITERRGQDRRRLVAAPDRRGTRATVVLSVDSLRVNDCTLLTQLLDEKVIARGEVDVIACVGGARRAHVLRIERVLEAEWDAIHRHRIEIGLGAVALIERHRLLERVGMLAEHFADGRGASRQRTCRRMAVRFTLAGHRTLATQIKRAKRISLSGIGHADRHAVLAVDIGIRCRRLEPPKLDWRSFIALEVRQNLRDRDGLRRIIERLACANHAGSCGYRLSIARHELVRDAVVGARTVDVALDETATRQLAALNRAVDVGDRRFLKAKLGIVRGLRVRAEAQPRRCDQDEDSEVILVIARRHSSPSEWPCVRLF